MNDIQYQFEPEGILQEDDDKNGSDFKAQSKL